jgi:nucleoside-diphosphate-sugar epimerase
MGNDIEVLVTGAAGWLGKGLVNALFNGIDGAPQCPTITRRARVMIMPHEDTSFFSQFGDRIEIFKGDIRNYEDCLRFTQNVPGAILYHTAGIIHPSKVSEFYEINLDGTKNLLNAAVKNQIKRAVVVSSNSPIGCNPTTDHRFTEESEFNPYMNYGRSKMLMEQFVMDVQAKGEIETVRIRAPWFYGPFQPPRQTIFFQMIRDGKGPIVGDGHNMRSMAYIDNLAQGLILAGHSTQASGEVYWIADETPYSMHQVLDTVESVMEDEFAIQCAHKRMKLPGIASDIAYYVDKALQSLGLYHQKIHVLSEMNKTIACSVEKAKRELGYKPTIALREGMRRSIAWMRENQSDI